MRACTRSTSAWVSPGSRPSARCSRDCSTPPVFDGRVAPLATVEFNMRDVYPPTHWAIRGTPPAYDTPDEDVYLVGRNLVLLTKAGVVAASRKAGRIALGPLAGNPFPDATPEFFAAMGTALVAGPEPRHHDRDAVRDAAQRRRHQDGRRAGRAARAHAVVHESADGAGGLPRHCGLCSKCRERRDAFAAAGIDDPTPYASASPR